MEDLDLKQLFEIFWNKKVQIIIIVIISILIGTIYSYAFTNPKYKSETSFLLVQKNGYSSESAGTTGITTSDLTLSQKLVSTYNVLIKSDSVIRQVISNLDLDISESALKSSITVAAVEDTQLIKVKVTNADAETAKDIANEIVQVFAEQVKGLFDIDNVRVIDKAETENMPYNINHVKDLIIFAFGGLVVSIIYVLIANMLDTTIKDKESIERATGLIVLTEIPICNFSGNADSKRGGKNNA